MIYEVDDLRIFKALPMKTQSDSTGWKMLRVLQECITGY